MLTEVSPGYSVAALGATRARPGGCAASAAGIPQRALLAAGDEPAAGGLLGAEQLADMGGRFQRYLAAIKHNGAIDKAQAGFVALAGRRALPRSSPCPIPAITASLMHS